ncbi:MAG: DegT/DnrJ/EryC1/StrS family aminotransferase [Bdellovibrionales bacterium]|nr:DegT/DnrJ/EryC1/StrS family aminotransferase [Bdellovibrionales bacterium]
MAKPLYVAQPLLPALSDFHTLLGEIWHSKALTNEGPFHQRLEAEIGKYLDVPTSLLFNNGTIALLAALKLYDLQPGSEVITTPLTFAATAHSISWNGLVPVFVDVLPENLTLDPKSVEKAITNKTSAIMAVHVYGSVCELEALQEIATRNNLRLLYDAAHAFGVTVKGRSIASFGDASIFSFHATKLFNTFEGGLVATPKETDKASLRCLRNFGIKNEEEVVSIGINGKMNELQAAIGLLNLPLIEEEKRLRSNLRKKYNEVLGHLPGITIQQPQDGVSSSEQYYPLIIDEGAFGRSRDEIYGALKEHSIFSRKYFHPICTDFSPYKNWKVTSTRPSPYVNTVKSRVLCLPFHSGVLDEHFEKISKVFVG